MDVNAYPWVVTAKILGKILGISERRVQQLREDGVWRLRVKLDMTYASAHRHISLLKHRKIKAQAARIR